MVFNLEKAVSHLQYKFKQDVFKPNKTDRQALNEVFTWINNTKKSDTRKHSLFIKLYVYYLTDIIRKNNSHVFESINQKQLHKLLDTELKLFFEAFKNDLYHNQLNKVLTECKFFEDLNTEDLKDKYNPEYITKQLISMATDALNKYS